MNKYQTNSTQTQPIMMGQPLYKTFAPPVAPMIQRQFIPMHTQTTVVVPVHNHHHLSLEPRPNKVPVLFNPPVIRSPVRWHEHTQHKNNFTHQNPGAYCYKQRSVTPIIAKECKYNQIGRQALRIKQQNQQLRLQNQLLLLKIQSMDRKFKEDVLEANQKREKNMLETASTSHGFNHQQPRINRIKSMENFKDFQIVEEPVYDSYLVNCCDKCTKSIFRSPPPLVFMKRGEKRESKYEVDAKRRVQKYNKMRCRCGKEENYKREVDLKGRIGKEEDINELIMRLKESNKALKSRARYI